MHFLFNGENTGPRTVSSPMPFGRLRQVIPPYPSSDMEVRTNLESPEGCLAQSSEKRIQHTEDQNGNHLRIYHNLFIWTSAARTGPPPWPDHSRWDPGTSAFFLKKRKNLKNQKQNWRIISLKHASWTGPRLRLNFFDN